METGDNNHFLGGSVVNQRVRKFSCDDVPEFIINSRERQRHAQCSRDGSVNGAGELETKTGRT